MNNYGKLCDPFNRNSFVFCKNYEGHSLFLEAGFPCCEKEWIERADFFRQRFEALLEEVLEIAEGNVHKTVLDSCELATEFTAAAEQKTEALSGIPINTGLTRAVCILRSGRCDMENNAVNRRVMQINRRAHSLLNGLIHFKEQILFGMREGRLFTTNYPLLIEHIIREAKLYRSMVGQLLSGKRLTNQSFCETEVFWNQIMMEHAWFIRGLLDPSEAQLIKTA